MKFTFKIILLVTFLGSNFLKAQDLQGEWKINTVLVDTLVQDYSLDTLSTAHFSYGNHLKLNLDGTFNSWYSAPCGNDCFTSSNGTYTQLDSNHYQFIIENVSYSGTCRNRTSPYTFPLNLGSFIVVKKENTIHLVKDGGTIE